MKCLNCPWNGRGLYAGETVNYCIGSPDDNTPEQFKHLIKPERIVTDEHGQTYLVKDDDECVLWFSPRFEKNPKGGDDE